MADDNQPVTGNGENETPQVTPSAGGQTPIAQLPPDIQTYIKELRDENAKWRTEKKKAEEAARKAEQERLVKDQQWKELAESLGKENEEYKAYKEKAELLEAGFSAALEGRLKTIPSDVRKSLVEPVRATMSAVDFSRWLDANEALLRTKAPPDPNAGAGASTATNENVQLSPLELRMAQAAGMTPAQYATNKKKLAALRATENEADNG